jgi:hypothetical protein
VTISTRQRQLPISKFLEQEQIPSSVSQDLPTNDYLTSDVASRCIVDTLLSMLLIQRHPATENTYVTTDLARSILENHQPLDAAAFFSTVKDKMTSIVGAHIDDLKVKNYIVSSLLPLN